MYGQENETDMMTQHCILLINDVKSLPKIHWWCIGNPIKVPIHLNGKETMVHGVMRNIPPVLIRHVVKCAQKGCLKKL